tara:strand:+ start:224 stop:706 length:483 start_codon:yes stop_codon:yes gene_type:complete
MKMSRRNQPYNYTHTKKYPKYIQYRTHHEIDIDDDEEFGLMLGIIGFIVGAWWGIVHLIDMFFNKLVWWQEPLTIIPFLVVGIPSLMLVELYGKNPMHWWPIFWGTKVTIPEREPFRAYDKEMEKSLKEFGPTRVYVLDYTTLKFRTKKDATLYCLKHLS